MDRHHRPRDEGYCPCCGTPYSFTPKLRPGDLLDGRYRVIGCLTHGGQGWIYLAEDIRLENRWVALKGLINSRDAAAIRAAIEERHYLIEIDHPDIVDISNYIHHAAHGSDQATGYIVMEFVGGRSLRQLTDPKEQLAAFNRRLRLEHVIVYGCKILDALTYLHTEKRLLYCDIKPHNVIHYEQRIKIIDLGALRRIDDRSSRLVITPQYAPPEAHDGRGLTTASDLYTVGVTLQELAYAAELPATGLGPESFQRVIKRATADDPSARFASAAKMSLQLRGVLREIRGATVEEQHPEWSTVFDSTAVPLDDGLGQVPALENFTDRQKDRARLGTGRPRAAQVAVDLPVPFPHPDDRDAHLVTDLNRRSSDTAMRNLRGRRTHTVETALCVFRSSITKPDLQAASDWLERAEELLGGEGSVGLDWRIAWHRGLLALAHEDVADAERMFDAVYSALPGEYAPKLALGYCAERQGHPEHAELFYQAVWQRDRTQVSAAFGLARVGLGRGDRAGAIEILDGIPGTSRHSGAARVAAVRILIGRLDAGPPSDKDIAKAASRLPGLHLNEGWQDSDARDRLRVEILQAALDWFCTGDTNPKGTAPAFAGCEPFDTETDQYQVRARLAQLYVSLAERARSVDDSWVLVDRAHEVRPMPRLLSLRRPHGHRRSR